MNIKRILISFMIFLFLCSISSCTQPEEPSPPKTDFPEEEIPHELSYHEILSLETIPLTDYYPAYGCRTLSELIAFIDSYIGSCYTCVEVECLKVEYCLNWDEEKQELGSGYFMYKLRILTKALGEAKGTAFSIREGDIAYLKDFNYLSVPSEDSVSYDTYRQALETVVRSFGAEIDSETGYITLASGTYELSPTSDMNLVFYNANSVIPMEVGECYSTMIEVWPGGGQCAFTYPVSEDNIVITNEFYNIAMDCYWKFMLPIADEIELAKHDKKTIDNME